MLYTSTVASSNKTVLVTKDCSSPCPVQINRVVLCQILKRQGIEVLECTTGLEAVQAFKQHGLAWPGSLLCILMVGVLCQLTVILQHYD